VGAGQFVMTRGNQFSASIISNNVIRVFDGDILMQGRHIRLNDNTYLDLTIDNGTQGQKRNDLIVARYTKNSTTGVEDCSLVVIKGTAVASSPADPAYTSGNIITDHALLNDMPLYRVPLDGLNVQALVPIFTIISTWENVREETAEEISAMQQTISGLGTSIINMGGQLYDGEVQATLTDDDGVIIQTDDGVDLLVTKQIAFKCDETAVVKPSIFAKLCETVLHILDMITAINNNIATDFTPSFSYVGTTGSATVTYAKYKATGKIIDIFLNIYLTTTSSGFVNVIIPDGKSYFGGISGNATAYFQNNGIVISIPNAVSNTHYLLSGRGYLVS